MIILGDIASPDLATTEQLQNVFEENKEVFDEKILVYNFEGLVTDMELLTENRSFLFNHRSVPSVLNRIAEPVFCMANNHILDFPSAFDTTISILKKEGIKFCGAGKSKDEASTPISFIDHGIQIFLFNACWDFLLYNQRNPSKGVHISEIKELKIIKELRNTKESFPSAAIVVFLHWSLDLETLPYPMYRQFSKDLIDAGANVVAGSHSHCVQGGEKYKNGYIAYGLGNFFIPNNVFINGKLTYPEFAKIQLALEWNPLNNKATCHWFEYQKNDSLHRLKHLGSDQFESSDTLKKYSPFHEMTDNEYLSYFIKNRRKKFMIPVYVNYKRRYTNKLLTFGLKSRARLAHLLARLNIIKWQN